MQLSNMPDYKAHLSRHGHNLSHDFTFTSSTGHLLTVFAQHMNPKEHIKGHINLFSRTQPLVGCPNVDIEEYIDYFFVPYDMFWTGFGESFFQTKEPFSTMITLSDGSLPVYDFSQKVPGASSNIDIPQETIKILSVDSYGLDMQFMSMYRAMFHNFINPNVLLKPIVDEMVNPNTTHNRLQVPEDFYQPSVFPAVVLAYNCVYQNFYRIDDREQFDASQYNIDSAMYNNTPLYEALNDKIWELKYRARQFDYFTGGAVAPLINPLNIQGGLSNQSLLNVNNYLSQYLDTRVFTQNLAGTNLNTPRKIGSDVGSVSFDSSSTVPSTANLRSVFAVEKLISVTNRAKKTYDAQVMAHFGVSVPVDYKHQIQFIGQQKGNIHVGEIISTAGTSDNALGDIAGKGYGNVNAKDIDFTAPCHGIFLGIFSCVPKVRYYTPLIKQWQLTNRLDFFLPEFEHLGMQPIFQWECAAIPYSWSYKNSLNWTARTSVEGWQMRYQQYKQQISRVSPAFAKTLFSLYNELGDPNLYAQGFNEWSSWVISQRPYDVNFVPNPQGTLNVRSFLAGPTMLNDIMAIQYPDVRQQRNVGGTYHGGYADAYDDSYWDFDSFDVPQDNRKSFLWNTASLFYRDPLIHFADCQFKLVSLMSDNTLPELAAV